MTIGKIIHSDSSTVINGQNVSIDSVEQNGGTLTINSPIFAVDNNYCQGNNAVLITTETAVMSISGDFEQAGTVTNNGKIIVKGDYSAKGSFNGGTLEIKQDINSNGTVNPEIFIVSGNMKQSIAGNEITTSINNRRTQTSPPIESYPTVCWFTLFDYPIYSENIFKFVISIGEQYLYIFIFYVSQNDIKHTFYNNPLDKIKLPMI